ncbi:MAG: sigma-54-dependent Fis family transcriptional regulator [Phycisphaeraceae bacterium]|nr:MAG: sigma-54-dependent Fis family transcriptional regulator [Phycisphaeraceae bacterium]
MSMVLVVDDKEMMRDSVAGTLERAGFEVATATDGAAALEMIARRRPAAVVTDLRMPGLSGIELIERIRAIDEELPIVLMTAFGTIETAVKAMRVGAFDYLTKPFEGDELVVAIKRAVQHAGVVRENAVLRVASGRADGQIEYSGLERLIGSSAAMRRVKEQVMAVASSHGNVLICGESGTGKEVVSTAIHEISPRAGRPMLAVNCAALSESLLESELFGHERGAFTGADRMRKGRFELADGGTLLLDEISEVSPSVQAKLLRVLQERAFERVGSSITIGVDVRVVATSNRDLPRSVSAGQFRQDLFFRLNVLPIHLPPLRDRAEDVPELAEHFVDEICLRDGRQSMGFEPDAMALLCSYSWPGNVRELQNICERAVVIWAATGGGSVEMPASLIEPWLLGGLVAPAPSMPGSASALIGTGIGSGLGQNGYSRPERLVEGKPTGIELDGLKLEEIERMAILRTLGKHDGHRLKTAKELGIGVRTLGLKIKKWKEEKIVAETL